MEERISVYLDGYPVEKEEEILERLARVSRKDAEVIKRLLQSGPVRLAKQVDEATADRFRKFLEPCGARLRFDSGADEDGKGTDDAPPPPESPAAATGSGGITPPQPLGFRRRLGWALAMVRRNVLTLVAIGILAFLSLLIVPAAMTLGFGLQFASVFGEAAMGLPLMALMGSPMALIGILGGFLLFFVVTFWLYNATVQIPAFTMANAQRAPVGRVLKTGFARTPEFITALGIAMLLPIPLQIASGASAVLLADSTLGLGVQLLILFALVWLSLSLAFVGPVAALERVGPLTAVRRSWQLARGLRLRLFGNGLLLVLLSVIAVLLVASPVLLLRGDSGALSPPLGLALAVVMALLMLVIIGTTLFFLVNFYFEARVLNEGWKPAWIEAPEASWSLSPETPEPPGSRGWRAWGELVLFSMAGIVLLAAIVWAVPARWMSPLPNNGPGIESPPARPTPQSGGVISPAPGPVDTAVAETGGSRLEAEFTTVFDQSDSRMLWVELELTKGEMELPDGIEVPVQVVIESVYGHGGEEYYDRDSRLETPFFQKVSLKPDHRGRMAGIRSVNLLPETTEAQIAGVRGHLELSLPLQVESRDLTASGETVELAGLQIELEELAEKEAKLRVRGQEAEAHWSGILGLTDGADNKPQNWSRSGMDDGFWASFGFREPIRGVRVMATEKQLKRRFAFDLKPKAPISYGLEQ